MFRSLLRCRIPSLYKYSDFPHNSSSLSCISIRSNNSLLINQRFANTEASKSSTTLTYTNELASNKSEKDNNNLHKIKISEADYEGKSHDPTHFNNISSIDSNEASKTMENTASKTTTTTTTSTSTTNMKVSSIDENSNRNTKLEDDEIDPLLLERNKTIDLLEDLPVVDKDVLEAASGNSGNSNNETVILPNKEEEDPERAATMEKQVDHNASIRNTSGGDNAISDTNLYKSNKPFTIITSSQRAIS